MDELLEFTRNLFSDHLSLAIDSLLTSKELNANSEMHPKAWVEARRQAMSSILHAYSGLESVVNMIGHSFFFDSNSPNYISPDTRDIPLKRMVQAWQMSLPCTDKVNYILSVSSQSLSPKLDNELRELTNLRNWITHGFSYKSMVLLDKQSDGTLQQVDREDSVSWKTKFPNTKFHPLDELNHEDAHTANRIVLEILKIISSQGKFHFWIDSHKRFPSIKFITPDFNIETFLQE
jgi:hypothetical protein